MAGPWRKYDSLAATLVNTAADRLTVLFEQAAERVPGGPSARNYQHVA
jgi:hypothetical protein